MPAGGAKVFRGHAETLGVEIKAKHKSTAPMHLESYQIDGKLLRPPRTFSASRLTRTMI